MHEKTIQFHICHESKCTESVTTYLSGGVDRDEDHVGALDLSIDVRRKKQVAAAALLHHVQQPGLVNGQIIRVPRVDLATGGAKHTGGSRTGGGGVIVSGDSENLSGYYIANANLGGMRSKYNRDWHHRGRSWGEVKTDKRVKTRVGSPVTVPAEPGRGRHIPKTQHI